MNDFLRKFIATVREVDSEAADKLTDMYLSGSIDFKKRVRLQEFVGLELLQRLEGGFFSSPVAILCSAFTWHETPEGREYWHNISVLLEKKEKENGNI